MSRTLLHIFKEVMLSQPALRVPAGLSGTLGSLQVHYDLLGVQGNFIHLGVVEPSESSGVDKKWADSYLQIVGLGQSMCLTFICTIIKMYFFPKMNFPKENHLTFFLKWLETFLGFFGIILY